MKKVILPLLLFFSFSILSAQTLDTVSMGAGYANQVWYKIDTDVETKQVRTNWDLAFSARRFDAAVWSNPRINVYRAQAAASTFATMTVDTLTLLDRHIQYNSDTSWLYGALNRSGDGVFDYGWGNYSLQSKNVTGDSVYVLKLASGVWKKFLIERMVYDTMWILRHANLDGSNDRRDTIKKSNYMGKGFAYFDFASNTVRNREPAAWDVTFWQYNSLTPDANGVMTPYVLTGLMHNLNVTVAKRISRDTASDVYTGVPFKKEINTIGAEWKNFNMTTNAWTVSDSSTFFVKLTNGKLYKIVFTKFGGSSTGNFIFTREYIAQLTSTTEKVENNASLVVSPNPATDGNISVVFDLAKSANNVDFQLINLAGQVVYNEKLGAANGLQTFNLPYLNLQSGMYLARLTFDGQQKTVKLIVK